MSENLFIKSHRYTNPDYRDEYERIFKDEECDLDRDIQTEMEKGQVNGHFI